MEILERIVSGIFEQVLIKIDKFPIEIYELLSFLPLNSLYPVTPLQPQLHFLKSTLCCLTFL